MKLSNAILIAVACVATACSKERVFDARDGTKICPVHGTRLQPDIVPMYYGTPDMTWEMTYAKAASTNFPHSLTHFEGGCVNQDGIEKARVLYCPKCRQAEAAWLRDHPYPWANNKV